MKVKYKIIPFHYLHPRCALGNIGLTALLPYHAEDGVELSKAKIIAACRRYHKCELAHFGAKFRRRFAALPRVVMLPACYHTETTLRHGSGVKFIRRSPTWVKFRLFLLSELLEMPLVKCTSIRPSHKEEIRAARIWKTLQNRKGPAGK